MPRRSVEGILRELEELPLDIGCRERKPAQRTNVSPTSPKAAENESN